MTQPNVSPAARRARRYSKASAQAVRMFVNPLRAAFARRAREDAAAAEWEASRVR